MPNYLRKSTNFKIEAKKISILCTFKEISHEEGWADFVKILRFFKKKFLIGPFWGGGTIFPRSLRTTGNKNCFQPRPKKFFFQHHL